MIPEAEIERLVTRVSHVLPSQKPIEAFVHHNTLHAFEPHPFHEGVERAAELFGARPYMAESAFRAAWQRGRIKRADLDAVLTDEVPDEVVTVAGQTIPLRTVVRTWMLWLPESDDGATLRWRLEETDELGAWPPDLPRPALERLSAAGPAHQVQPALWRALHGSRPARRESRTVARPRDRIVADFSTDPDALVHPTLIRWCGAFLDPDHAYWPMTDRERGFYWAMLVHLAQPGHPGGAWTQSITGRAQLLLSSGTSATRCIAETLHRLGCPADGAEALLRETLLALPGWPGMFVQLAARPDLAPAPPPPTPLEDFLAIRLLMDEAAARWISGVTRGALSFAPVIAERTPEADWTLFNAARYLGVTPGEVNDPSIQAIEGLLHRYGDVRRRWYWQLAYERRYRIGILDAIVAHAERIADDPALAPHVQVVTCIDDREESLRRHLEEIDPRYETLGVAGFYGVAAYVQLLGDPHRRPLCPAPVVPTHLLREMPADKDEWDRIRSRRGLLGRLGESLAIGSDTLFRGGLISLWGWSSVLPLVTRILAPRLHARLVTPRREPQTTLQLEANGDEDDGLQVGFTPEEMGTIVRGVLEDMGLTRGFAPLVVVLGHGSRSLNNPHEAAHDCGACGGGRGGPNARAFAQMANRADVRAWLREAGIDVPDQMWFVGGYHNTCDDAVDLFDLDAVPEELQGVLAQLQVDLDEARRLDAHERARRFESAPLDLDPLQALAHVEARADDLAQPRPEYGHCTNALCLVGRRAWSRGLFLDRRVFLTSYDPTIDPDGRILERLLASVGPVGAGINLEYYFSFVDPDRYGCNTKLPHNITALLGVMDGHSSDLRTGLPWQMVEIHEPVRLLNVIEARPERLSAILERQPALKRLIENRWILIAAFDAETRALWFYERSGFVEYVPESKSLSRAESSMDWYRGHRGHLLPATIERGRPRPTGGEA